MASYRLHRITTSSGTVEVNITSKRAAAYLRGGATVEVFTPGIGANWSRLESAGRP